MTSVTYTIPTPPSVNSIWRHGRGNTFRSRGYKQWRDEALWEVMRQGVHRFGDAKVRVELALPSNMRGDVDNRAKAAGDLLQTAGVVDDDKHVADFRAYRSETYLCRITVEALT